MKKTRVAFQYHITFALNFEIHTNMILFFIPGIESFFIKNDIMASVQNSLVTRCYNNDGTAAVIVIGFFHPIPPMSP